MLRTTHCCWYAAQSKSQSNAATLLTFITQVLKCRGTKEKPSTGSYCPRINWKSLPQGRSSRLRDALYQSDKKKKTNCRCSYNKLPPTNCTWFMYHYTQHDNCLLYGYAEFKTTGYITSPNAPRPITLRISKSSLWRRICFTLDVKGLAIKRREVGLVEINKKGCARDKQRTED